MKSADLDALLLHEPQLHAGWLGTIEAGAPALSAVSDSFRASLDSVRAMVTVRF